MLTCCREAGGRASSSIGGPVPRVFAVWGLALLFPFFFVGRLWPGLSRLGRRPSPELVAISSPVHLLARSVFVRGSELGIVVHLAKDQRVHVRACV